MNYQLEIQGMHCKGCQSLIQMSLEDEQIKVININVRTGISSIASPANTQAETESLLKKVFTGLPGYSFSKLTQLN